MKRRYAICNIALGSVVLFSNVAVGEVFNCNGTWTDKPCDAASSPKTSADEAAALEAKEHSMKRSLVHELTMKAIDTSRSYKVRYDTAGVENYCLDRETSLEDCQAKVNEMHDRIDERVASLQLVEEQKRANDLQQERNEIEANKPNQINVIQETNYYIKRGRRYPRNPSYGRPHFESEASLYRNNADAGYGRSSPILVRPTPVIITHPSNQKKWSPTLVHKPALPAGTK